MHRMPIGFQNFPVNPTVFSKRWNKRANLQQPCGIDFLSKSNSPMEVLIVYSVAHGIKPERGTVR